MSTQPNELPDETREQLALRILQLNARCDALLVLLVKLAEKSGFDPATILAEEAQLRAESLQETLERVEKASPALAARLSHAAHTAGLDMAPDFLLRPDNDRSAS